MNQSRNLYQFAQQYIPGGVNSPVRAYYGVDGDPLFIKSGHGAYIIDADDKEYVDYVGSWGPLIVGHAHPYVVDRVQTALHKGFSFGAPTEVEIQLARKVTELMPAIEMVRFVSSGTEAAMSAIRLARGFTKRNKIIKFSGCYHGHSDSLLVAAGSGGLTLGIPNSLGVPESFVQHTLIANFNDLESVSQLFTQYGEDIAGVIVEPVAGNMNCVLPAADFLAGLRLLCDRYGSLLIFDEVITGFRVALGGAQAHFGIKPDLTILGKIIGGGFPVGAFGGRKEVMQILAPLGGVYQAGTLSGNPIAMTAGLATLELISQPHFYTHLTEKTAALTQGLKACAQQANIPLITHAIGGMFGLFFTKQTQITTEAAVKQCNISLFKRFFHAMLSKGIYLAPSAFESGFISSAHQQVELQKTWDAATETFAELKIEYAC